MAQIIMIGTMRKRSRSSRRPRTLIFLALVCLMVSNISGVSGSQSQYGYGYNDDSSGSGDFSSGFKSSINDLRLKFSYAQPPRDAIQGISRAIVVSAKGGLGGLPAIMAYRAIVVSAKGGLGGLGGLLAIMACPIMLFSKMNSLKGLFLRVMVVVIRGVGSPIAGVLSGLHQIAVGIVRSPDALKNRLKGQCFNYDTAVWEYYRMDRELQSINNNSAGNGDLEFYHVLDVKPQSSPGEIKKAYYKMAKHVHPDKDPSEQAARQFALLSKAYETLSDERKRRRYDSHQDVNDDDSTPSALELLPVLLGFTTTVLHYVGDLRVAMFLDRALQKDRRTGERLFWDKKTADMYHNMQRRREIHIGMHLQKQIQPYLDGVMDSDAFREACRQEAVLVGEGDHGIKILRTLGRAVTVEAGVFLSTYSPALPHRYLTAWGRKKTSSIAEQWGVTKKTFKSLHRSVKTAVKAGRIYKEMEEQDPRNRKPDLQDKEVLKEFARLVEEQAADTLPVLLDMAWTVVLRDVSRTVKTACDKLFHDASVDPSAWKRRAEAVLTIGREFLILADEKQRKEDFLKEQSNYDNQDLKTTTIDDIIQHVEVSFVIADKKKKGIKVTKEEHEQIIRARKRRRS